MIGGGFCQATCGPCTPQAAPLTTTAPVSKPPSTPVQTIQPPAQPSAQCNDLPPPGNYTCAQQKVFGACTRPWMTTGGYCRQTCGACVAGTTPNTAVTTTTTTTTTTVTAPPLSEQVAAAAAAALPVAQPVISPPPVTQINQQAPVPAAEQQRVELTAAAASLAAQTPVTEATVLPVINLPEIGSQLPTPPPEMAPVPAPVPVAPAPTPAAPVAPVAPQEGAAGATSTGASAPAGTNAFLELAQRLAPLREGTNVGLAPRAVPITETAASTTSASAPVAAALPPITVAPGVETQRSGCNTTSAFDILRSDPDLSTTLQAVEVLNLGNVLQNPNINFTVRRREIFSK